MRLVVWGTSLIMLVHFHGLSTGFASELESLRLFHEPALAGTVDLPLAKDSQQASTVKPNPIADEVESKPVARASARVEYHYNGFIKTKAGVFHFVNGVPVSDLKNIEFVSTSDNGRSVQLVTRHGYEFTLSVGDAIQVPQGIVSDNNQKAVNVTTSIKAFENSKIEDKP